ncbi:MAG TPA: hypothetical protein VF266_22645 [Thermoanaerobaculia bacterium]
MATTKKKTTRKRRNPVPRLNPKNGPPVYFPEEPTSIPIERIEEAVRTVLAAHGMLHPKALAKMRKSQQ